MILVIMDVGGHGLRVCHSVCSTLFTLTLTTRKRTHEEKTEKTVEKSNRNKWHEAKRSRAGLRWSVFRRAPGGSPARSDPTAHRVGKALAVTVITSFQALRTPVLSSPSIWAGKLQPGFSAALMRSRWGLMLAIVLE